MSIAAFYVSIAAMDAAGTHEACFSSNCMPVLSQADDVGKRVAQLHRRRLGDETRAALAGEIRPHPLALHAQPVLQLRQREDVNERPDQVGQETTSVHRPLSRTA